MSKFGDWIRRTQAVRRAPAIPYPLGVPVDVCDLFEKNALQVRMAGFTRYSARTIIEIIRWHFQVEQGKRDFKVNDHWSPRLSRWMIRRHPEFEGFFELRVTNEERRARAGLIEED